MDRPISKPRLLEIASNPSSEKYDDNIGHLVAWGLQEGLIHRRGAFSVMRLVLCGESLDVLGAGI